MNNVFNRVKMLKLDEYCDKYSKRFLYKNLVGGTATTGTGIKQTQRLSEGSANKPLSAVGTLTSLLCNSAKVMEYLLRHVITRRTSVRRGYLPEKCTHANKESLFASVTYFMRLPRRIQRMLLVMTISMLALLFTIATTAESRAEVISCVNGKYADGTDCEKCGDNCNWKIEDGTLSVFGSGNMYDYEYKEVNGWNHYVNSSDSTPWAGYNIETIDIEGVNNVGKGVFAFMTGVKSVNIKSPVRDILFDAFWGTHSLETVTLSDSVNTIEQGSFNSENLKNIVIPDTVKSLNDWDTFGRNLDSLNNLNIVCLGGKKTCENIKQMLKNYGYGDGKRKNLYDNVSVANYQQCNSTNYYWNGAECVHEPDVSKRKCCDSCKDMGGWCNRVRYTLAEAAEVLRDGNTNEVTITFKK